MKFLPKLTTWMISTMVLGGCAGEKPTWELLAVEFEPHGRTCEVGIKARANAILKTYR